jgi:DNA-directed RNA polymerase specialized sigma24 family protein
MQALASTVLALPAPENRVAMRKQHAHLSDEALVALVARGDEDALAELYDRVSRIAYGLALRVLRDERYAEDAVQEAFLQVWRRAATFRADRAKARTWILTLVHRRSTSCDARNVVRRTR